MCRVFKEDDNPDEEKVDYHFYYRHMAGVYKSYQPDMIRTLRSDSVERSMSPGKELIPRKISVTKIILRAENPFKICAFCINQLNQD